MTSSRSIRFAGLALAGLLTLAACGGGDDDDATTTTEAAGEGTTTTADDETTTTAGELEDPTEEVTAAYLAFFLNFSGDLTLLEDGDAFAADLPAMQAAAASAGTIAVDVHAVTALDEAGCDAVGVIAPCAEVSFDLVVNDVAAVPDQTGYAVNQDGTWKVAKTTFCSLASLSGSVPAAC